MDAPMKLTKAVDLQPINSNKEYAAASEKARQIRGRMRRLEARKQELDTKITIATLPLDKEEFGARVNEVLAGKLEPDNPPMDIGSARIERDRILEELRVLRAALGRQREIVNGIVSELSLAAANEVLAEHKSAVSAIANALDELKRSALAEQDLRRHLKSLGYDECLPSFHVPEVLRFRDDNWARSDFYQRVSDYLK